MLTFLVLALRVAFLVLVAWIRSGHSVTIAACEKVRPKRNSVMSPGKGGPGIL